MIGRHGSACLAIQIEAIAAPGGWVELPVAVPVEVGVVDRVDRTGMLGRARFGQIGAGDRRWGVASPCVAPAGARLAAACGLSAGSARVIPAAGCDKTSRRE